MSDSVLRIIPQDPEFTPSADAQAAALATLREALRKADAVRVRETQDVKFIDVGENFESIFCPSCKNEIDQDWWIASMEQAASTKFTDLAISPPCCHESTTLNDLRYVMPLGFARFVLEVLNPDVADLPRALVARLEKQLGCALRIIWARY